MGLAFRPEFADSFLVKIVLVHPLIPQNTGSVGRLCAATRTELVLVEPLGFSLDDRYLKRAGLDYWPWIPLTIAPDWRTALPPGCRPWLFTAHTDRSFYDADYRPDDLLVFGRETTGLPADLLDAFPREQQLRIPFENQNVRSLNLAQCAAVAYYEARRQVMRTPPG
ncbi:tRNA (cytidine(34)-2'-O)-methyltransferase [Myxococcota bacterium]|nr:tRNA (cytidine(34)-2'-O)-methyltransferase [Myxococcota bacterium]